MYHMGLTYLLGQYLGGSSFLVIINVASMDIYIPSICVFIVLGIYLLDHMVLFLAC